MSLASLLSARSVTREVAEIIRPSRRLSPDEAVEQYLRSAGGPWQRELAPMMIEPLNLLGSRLYTGIVFIGPSRTSKTFSLVIGGITYVVTCSPADTLVVHNTEAKARAFSRKDVDRAIRHSPELESRLSPRPRDDNVFDKFFRSGMVLQFSWPSASQLAGDTYKYVFIPDYDRPENRDDVDGEGSVWDLASVRPRTFLSRGKCLAESSPGGEYTKAEWIPSTPHEAPPADGICAIYNRGTRARWYWPCIDGCGEYFQAQPGLANFKMPEFEELEREVLKKDLMWFAEQLAWIACPHCGHVYRQERKRDLNARGVWLHEGETIRPDGRVEGDRRRTQIASFWQGGVSATYQSWVEMILRYLQGVQTYARTGDESALRSTTNTDQAAPYLPRAAAKRRTAEQLLKRLEDWPRGVVPPGVRFIIASIDVQLRRFVVQFYGWGEGLQSWLIERMAITGSRRTEAGGRAAGIDPASYPEDWEILVDEVITRTFPLQADPQRRLHVELTLCDSGGQEGVTTNAYEFWRSARDQGLGNQFFLVRGNPSRVAPSVAKTWPDARERKDRRSGARGDVPVWQLNVNLWKDTIVGDLGREQPGPGYVHLPRWLQEEEPEFFEELMAETRTDRGWVKDENKRNEAFDLHVYARAGCKILQADAIDWSDPPAWARDPLSLDRTDSKSDIDLAAIAAQLNGN
jgi:phage terminase large subunit GpA-like protein